MKIKETNLGIWFGIIVGTAVYVKTFLWPMITTPHYFSTFYIKGLWVDGVFISCIVSLVMFTLFGSYIEIKNDELIQSEGYTKKLYRLEKISKIYYKGHFFLGPTLLMDYRDHETNQIMPKKLMVLGNYKKPSTTKLLQFLHKTYPTIQFDEFCHEVIDGKDPKRK